MILAPRAASPDPLVTARSRRRWSSRVLALLLVASVCGLLQLAVKLNRHLAPLAADASVVSAGSFVAGGWHPGEPFVSDAPVRAWGSWHGSDQNTGRVTVGPFTAPPILHLGVGGYPATSGNTMRLQLAEGGPSLPLEAPDIGERWQVLDFAVPRDWQGRPVRLFAADESPWYRGWFAVTEPLRTEHVQGIQSALTLLAGLATSGFLLGVVAIAAARVLGAANILPPWWIPLGAGGIVAAVGAAVHIGYWIHPWVGLLATFAALAAAVGVVVVRRPALASHRDGTPVLALTAAIAVCYVAIVHLAPNVTDFSALTAQPVASARAGENLRTFVVAEQRFAHRPVVAVAATADANAGNSVLQSGVQLFTWPAFKLLNADRRSGAVASALWLQLLWVPAAYGLLRTLALSPRRAAGWTATLALSGFVFHASTFTTAQLTSAAFACGAFGLLVPSLATGRSSPTERTPSSKRDGAAALGFAALACLADANAAIALLPLVLFAMWRAARSRAGSVRATEPAETRPTAENAATPAHDHPSANPTHRFDSRGVVVAAFAFAAVLLVVALMRAAPEHDASVATGRWSTFARHITPDWKFLTDVAVASGESRRTLEVSTLVRALGAWPLVALLALVLNRTPWRDRLRAWRGGMTAAVTATLLLAGWLVTMLAGWALVVAAGGSAALARTTYALPLASLLLCSVVLDRAGRGWLISLAAIQATFLVTTWIIPSALAGPPTALPLLLVGASVLLVMIVRAVLVRDEISAPTVDVAEDAATTTTTATAAPRSASRSEFPRPAASPVFSPRGTVLYLLALAAVLALRKPDALHTPQLWAEDGSIFLTQNDLFGPAAITFPYMGYLHVLPRLVAWCASLVLDPKLWPAFYNGVSFALWVAVLGRFISRRFDLPARPWLPLAFVLGPNTGEVLFNITNLQWLTAFVLIQQAVIARPTTRGQRIGDLAILAVVGLTGPFVVAFAPLFAWRWWRDRHRDNLWPLLVVGVAASVQAWFILRTGPHFEYQSQPFNAVAVLVVLVRRVLVWPVLGESLALQLAPMAIATLGGAALFALLASALRRDRWQDVRVVVVGAFALIVLASVSRTRPDTWAADNLYFGDRYFFIPRVLVGWLLLWQLHAQRRWIAQLARLACVTAVLLHLPDYRIAAPPDLHWAQHCQPIRDGVSANIPILPEGWTLEYRGRRH